MSDKARWYLIWTIAIVVQWLALLGLCMTPGDPLDKLIMLSTLFLGVNAIAFWLARSTGYAPPRLAMIFGSGGQSEKEELRLLRQEGVAALKQGNYARMVEIYTRIVQLDQGTPEVYLARAQSRVHLKDLDAAVKDFTIALVTGEKLVKLQSLLGRGRIYLERGDLDLALDDFSEALEHDAESTQALDLRRHVYEKKGLPDLAGADHRKITELNRRVIRVSVDDLDAEIDVTSMNMAALDNEERFQQETVILVQRVLKQLSRKVVQETAEELPDEATDEAPRTRRFEMLRTQAQAWIDGLTPEQRTLLRESVEQQLRGYQHLAR